MKYFLRMTRLSNRWEVRVVEFTLENKNIFDKDIGVEFDKLIKDNITLFDKDKVYEVSVNFNVDLTYNEALRIFDNSMYNDIDNTKSQHDRLYEALRKQLHEIDKVLCDHGLNAIRLSINGIKIEPGAVEILIDEEISEINVSNRRSKNNKRMKCYTTSPDREYIVRTLGENINRDVLEGFYKMRDRFTSLEWFCKVFELPFTKNQNKLYKSFYERYEKLFNVLASEEQRREILDRLDARLEVLIREAKSSNSD
jgi:hypothetical protein